MEEDFEKKASIRDIAKPNAMPGGRRKVISKSNKIASASVDDEMMLRRKERRQKRIIARTSLLIGAIIILTIVLISTVFARASIMIEINKINAPIDGEFTAETGTSLSDTSVPYTFVNEILTLEKSSEINATGEEDVQESSTGTLTVYNESGTSPIRLRVGTRFETESGLVYRTDRAITVPGQRRVDGEVKPGTLDIQVYADSAGGEYNIQATDLRFTLPGLKEGGFLDEYATVYARNKTSLSGGFSGKRLVASEKELEAQRESLREKIKTEAKQTILAEKLPENSILFDDLIDYNFTSLPQEDNKESNKIKLTETANINIIVFNENSFVTFLASKLDIQRDTLPNRILNVEELNFVLLDKNDFNITEDEKFEFSVTGGAELSWDIDIENIKDMVIGLHKRDVPTKLKEIDGIKDVEITLFPGWIRKIPINENKVMVEVTQEEN